MIRRITYECQACGYEIEVEVEINEGDDLPENCPECGQSIADSAHESLVEQAAEEGA